MAQHPARLPAPPPPPSRVRACVRPRRPWLQYVCVCAVSKLLNMVCCWVEDPNSDAFKRHLARVPDFFWLSEDGMKAQDDILRKAVETYKGKNWKKIETCHPVDWLVKLALLLVSYIAPTLVRCISQSIRRGTPQILVFELENCLTGDCFKGINLEDNAASDDIEHSSTVSQENQTPLVSTPTKMTSHLEQNDNTQETLQNIASCQVAMSEGGKVVGFQPTSRLAVNHWATNPLASSNSTV